MAIEPSGRRSTGLVFGIGSLLLLMLLCCAVFAAWRASRQRYQAECVLRVRREPAAGIVDEISEYMRFKETQGALLKSFVVLSAAAKNPRVAAILANENDPVKYLDERVQVDVVDVFGQSDLLRVRLRGGDPVRGSRDPEMLCIVLDGVVDAYLKSIVEDDAWQRETLDIVQSLISVSRGEEIDQNELRRHLELLPASFVRDRLISNLEMLENGDSPEMIIEDLESMEQMLSKPRIQVIQRATVPTSSWP